MGRRVSVRRVTHREDDGSLRFGDVVGELLSLDEQSAVIETRTGPVDVALGLVTVARLVPASTRDELDLEAVMAKAVSPAHVERLGGWLLRADVGTTHRANSVLPLGTPGFPLDEALARAAAWYAGHGRPVQFALPVEARRLLDAELAERGWPAQRATHVLTRRLPGDDRGAVPEVSYADRPDADWLALFGTTTGPPEVVPPTPRPDTAKAGQLPAGGALLAPRAGATYVSVRRDGRVCAIGRGTVDDGWLGITALAVDPEYRRRGFAQAVIAGLWAWGHGAGARRSFVQVQADNDAARALYEALGYRHHHDYHYRQAPEQP